VIVDDGSTDDTQYTVSQMKDEAPFEIVYEKQKNQGKHIAINKGVLLAKGKYFFIVDSDDRLPENSLAIISSKFTKVKEDDSVAGVVGLKCFFDQSVVGSKAMNSELLCSQLEHRYLYNNTGDRAEVLKTNIFKQFPFPKFGNENFIPESIVWNRMAQKYKMLYFPENVYECEYLEDGLSSKSVHLRRQNPIGASTLYAELGAITSIKTSIRIKAYVNFWRFFLCLPANHMRTQVFLLKNHIFTPICLPLGIFLFIKDSLVKKRKKK